MFFLVSLELQYSLIIVVGSFTTIKIKKIAIQRIRIKNKTQNKFYF
jgi:hypothetical protein